jgi:hypothetical protein
VPESAVTTVVELSVHGDRRGDVRRVTVAAGRDAQPARLVLQYRLEGRLGGLAIPAPAAPRRTDRLWEHTCFEAFLRPAGQPGYDEYNFSPSGEWAAYRFAGRRSGMQPLALVQPPAIACLRTGDRLDLRVTLEPGPFAGRPVDVGLCAVIEAGDGSLSWWALRHPAGPPDFHDPESFTLRLDGATAATAGDGPG